MHRVFLKTRIQRLALATVLLMAGLGIFGRGDELHLHVDNAPIFATTNVGIVASGGSGGSGGSNGTATPDGVKAYARLGDVEAFSR